ncbi:putative AP2 domain-containing protein [Vibrio phage 501E54-1]|nr:putative AP2 domain-containing protein [Vibrio phage 501E54-1]
MRKDSKVLKNAAKLSNGMYEKTYKTSNGVQLQTKEYRYWHNMNTRCNNKNYKKKFPTYEGVFMSELFTDYNKFVDWCNLQPEFHNNGWVLDKDIFYIGNKCYGEDSCTFVPNEVNGFFVIRSSKRDTTLPVGVSWCESEERYKVYCSQLNGKNKTVGRFTDVDSAAEAYVSFKNSLADTLADTWEGRVDRRVIKALRNFDIRDYITEEVSTYKY